jgi:ferredoxin
MNFKTLIRSENTKRKAILSGQVVPDASRCVQCGVCTFHCPIGIDIRRHAWLGQSIEDSHCLTCGECVIRCPRGVLKFERLVPQPHLVYSR